jgi:hypothetical protein
MVMAIAEDMKKMTENILASRHDRAKVLTGVATDTHKIMADARKSVKGFSADRTQMAAKQARDLAGFAGGLSKNVHVLLKDAQNFVKEIRKDHTQMSEDQAKKLSGFAADLTRGTGAMLDGFNKSRNSMAKELKGRLAKEIKGIRGEVKNILNEADKFVGGFRADMTQARKAWQNMGVAAKGGFAKSEIKTDGHARTAGRAANTGKRKKGSKAKK